MRLIYLCIQLLPIVTPQDRNRVWTCVFICSSFPCLLHFFYAFRILSFDSSHIASFTVDIWFRFFHPWCPFVWVITCFISRMEKNLWAIQSFYWLMFSLYHFDIYFIAKKLWLFKPFVFNLWHGIILNTIHLSILLPFRGAFVVSFLGYILMWSGWSPKIVF